ncbi:MAG: hypothetical protein K0U74_04940 [Alphaproteobacteria bacterium]|nr:hypothetical protein [Alphaproteobacteria bacterium]
MRNPLWLYAAVSLVIGFILAIATVAVERPYTGVVGNLCEKSTANPSGHCYDQLPAAGWPFRYIYDFGGISVQGVIGPEDDFYAGLFMADALIFAVAVFAILIVLDRGRRRGSN